MQNQQRVKFIVVGLGLTCIAGIVVLASRALNSGGAVTPSVTRRDRNQVAKDEVPAWHRAGATSDYAVVDQRALFQSKSTARLNEKPTSVEPLVVALTTTAPSGGERPRIPLDDRIAAIGIVQLDGARQVIMEDLGRGETRFTRVGDRRSITGSPASRATREPRSRR